LSSSIQTGEAGKAHTGLDVEPYQPPDRPLVLYVYFESESARTNLDFFVKHALNGAADFIFILKGENTAADTIPRAANIRVIERSNECYDIGAAAAVLVENDLYKRYKRYIMINASVRGPFVPIWSKKCWMDMYLERLSESVKVQYLDALRMGFYG
jgi:hypothetical protein